MRDDPITGPRPRKKRQNVRNEAEKISEDIKLCAPLRKTRGRVKSPAFFSECKIIPEKGTQISSKSSSKNPLISAVDTAFSSADHSSGSIPSTPSPCKIDELSIDISANRAKESGHSSDTALGGEISDVSVDCGFQGSRLPAVLSPSARQYSGSHGPAAVYGTPGIGTTRNETAQWMPGEVVQDFKELPAQDHQISTLGEQEWTALFSDELQDCDLHNHSFNTLPSCQFHQDSAFAAVCKRSDASPRAFEASEEMDESAYGDTFPLDDELVRSADVFDAAASSVFDKGPCPMAISQSSHSNAAYMQEESPQDLDDEFADPELDLTLAELDMSVSLQGKVQVVETSPLDQTCSSSPPRLQWLPPKIYQPRKPASSKALTSGSSSPRPLVPMSSPAKKPEPSASILETPKINRTKEAKKPPITRPPFPSLLPSHSPVTGLSKDNILRVCFRIGEALNATGHALRTNTNVLIELYARVISSSRDTGNAVCKQRFQFGDLFTMDQPPFLPAVYSLWKGVPLWDRDSAAFLGKGGRGKLCRVIGRIRRQKEIGGWEMSVLSVWECD